MRMCEADCRASSIESSHSSSFLSVKMRLKMLEKIFVIPWPTLCRVEEMLDCPIQLKLKVCEFILEPPSLLYRNLNLRVFESSLLPLEEHRRHSQIRPRQEIDEAE